MPRKTGNAGKQISITLSPYIHSELKKLEKKMGIKKSSIISIAIEKYARAEESQGEKK